ncbi:retrovirus-related pol polyprotein from transposon TNT 1-94 [Tanacetum coccineum]
MERCFINYTMAGYDRSYGIFPKLDYVVQIVLGYLDSSCSKHMTRNRSWLKNSMKKFIGTVRFGNDHFSDIIGYGDYVIGDSVISKSINGKKYILVIVDDYSRFTWVKFLRSKDEIPEFVIKFLKQIQVGLTKTVRYIRTDNATKFVNQVLTKFYESVGISHQKSVSRHSTPSNRSVVRSYMRILSVVSLKTFSRYGYTFLKEIVLHRDDYKEYKISEADFKNLHSNDFEDLYLLHLQEDYTIVHKPRAVIYKDRNNQKKMMRETEVHKFNDGTLTRILKKLDFMVKDYELFKFNPGMEHRIWSEDDKRRSQEFIKLIKRRLKIRSISS